MPKLSAKNSAIKQYITLGSSVGNFLVTRSKITKFQTQIRDKIRKEKMVCLYKKKTSTEIIGNSQLPDGVA